MSPLKQGEVLIAAHYNDPRFPQLRSLSYKDQSTPCRCSLALSVTTRETWGSGNWDKDEVNVKLIRTTGSSLVSGPSLCDALRQP